MSFVRFDRATLAYGDGRPVLEDVDLDLRPGWTGVVGANGAGKTTLLLATIGQLAPARGAVHRQLDATAFVRQRVDAVDEEVRTLAERWTKRAVRLKRRLGLEDDDLGRWSQLSQGQRKRWQVGAALELEPDLLVLDEPTNHLDAQAKDILLRALQRFEGVGVVVSHDRAFLEALARQTLLVADGTVRRFAQPYGAARAAWEAEDAREITTRAANRERMQAELQRLRRVQRSAEAAGHQRSARRRMKGVKDHDARGVGAGARAAKAEATLSHRAGALRTRVDAAQRALSAQVVRRAKGGKVAFSVEEAGPSRILRLVDEPVLVEGRPLLRPVTVVVDRGMRILVAGPNGSGKSTLVRLLERRCAHVAVRVAQDRTRAEAEDHRRALFAAPPEERGRIMQLVALLGTDPSEILGERPLTPGQAQKLALAAALGQRADLVLLDEPTSHLDLPAVERLQDALTSYDGALVLVTHDAALAEAATDEVWTIEQGELRT